MEFLLPNYPGLKLQRTYVGQDRLLLLVSSTHPNALCPNCKEVSNRVHSYYLRTLKDLSWADYTVRFLLLARRFYCLNSACAKTTFAERFGKAIKAYARRTNRCDIKLKAIANELGGTAGARLSTHMGIKVSRDTLLRILAREELPATSTRPKVIGIDDWA